MLAVAGAFLTGLVGPAAAQLPAQAERIVPDIVRHIQKSKVKGEKGSRLPAVIVLGSLIEAELTVALASKAKGYEMGAQSCAHNVVKELKLPPREFLHYAVAAWIARRCHAQLAIIAGSEETGKKEEVRLNIGLLRSRDGKTQGSWTTLVPSKALSPPESASPASAVAQAAPASLPQGDAPVRAGRDGIGLPVCAYCPNPSFTKEASFPGYFGRVLLRVLITREGSVGEIHLAEGAAFGLNEQAINAVRKWRLKPATDAQGNPVNAWTRIEVTFRSYHF